MIEYDKHKPISLTADVPIHIARDWRNNPEIWKWCRQYSLISSDEQFAWAEKIETDPSIKMFGVYEEDNAHVGVCGFTSIDRHNRNAEFSLYIGKPFQGSGYGEKALRTLIRHGFEDWGFKRIWGEVFEDNPAMKMFDKIGFKHEGWLRSSYFRKGRYIDSRVISILDTEYYH